MRHLALQMLALVAFVRIAQADPLHAIVDGAYWHHDSGWVFPSQVGEFARVGAPQDVDGSRDVIAYYERGAGASRTLVTVQLYPNDTIASDASLVGARAAIEAQHTKAQAVESELEVASEPRLTATKIVYRSAEAETRAAQLLYHVDTGSWFVKILSKQGTGLEDDFVRSQQWQKLVSSAELCTGASCAPLAKQ